MTTKPKCSLSTLTERIIAGSFYSKDAFLRRQRAYAYGLMTPLWLWGLQGFSEEKEQQRIVALLQWLLRSKRGHGSIAVIVPSDWKAPLQNALEALPEYQAGAESTRASLSALAAAEKKTVTVSILVHHELSVIMRREPEKHHAYDVVVYALGLPPTAANLNIVSGQEEWLRDALEAVECSFILLADLGWTSMIVRSKWPQWKLFLDKIETQPLPLSSSPELQPSLSKEKDLLPCLAAKSIPLCCSAHPNQRFMDYGLGTIHSQCQRLCLHPFTCGVEQHTCHEKCHTPAHHTAACPYRCIRELACGHQCLQRCSEPCNCFEILSAPLPCYHETPIGLQKETGETIYARVEHVFRGPCVAQGKPCHVGFTTECARCWGELSVLCCEASERGHTLSRKTLICENCQRIEKEVRAEILGAMLCEKEMNRKRMRIEMSGTIHQKRKAADQGLFTEGSRVEIVDSSRCAPPLDTEMFSHVEFMSMDTPNFFSTLQGAYGTFISSHLIDATEILNLVRLPNGLHVLVGDGGLRLIHAAAQHVVHNSSLMITYASEKSEGDVEKGAAQEADVQAKMSGKLFYVSSPAIFSLREEEKVLYDCVAKVIGPSTEEGHALVEVCSYSATSSRHEVVVASPALSCGGATAEPPDTVPFIARTPVPDSVLMKTTYRFNAPLTSLEPMEGFQAGKKIYPTRPERQVRDTVLLNFIAEMFSETTSSESPTFSAGRVQENTPYEVLTVLNAPIVDQYRNVGPVVVVRAYESLALPKSTRFSRKCHRGGARKSSAISGSASHPEATVKQIFAIPYVFTRADEEAEAEELLDEAAQKVFQTRLNEALEKKYEDLAFRNDEHTFHKLERMPRVTEEMEQEQRMAYSTPVPIPTEQEIANIKQRYITFPIATARGQVSHFQMAQMKDTIARKKEALALQGKWVTEVSPRLDSDRSSDMSYIRSSQLQLTKK